MDRIFMFMKKNIPIGLSVPALLLCTCICQSYSNIFYSETEIDVEHCYSPADLWGILSEPGNRVQTFFLD